MRCSVCIATYNGEKFIERQLISILSQLSNDDEVVIVDDCSSDNTAQIINSIQDQRIRVFRNNHNCGVLATFEKSLLEARGNIIFFSDQDDVWMEGKVNRILHEFDNNHVDIVQHDAIIVDGNLKIIEKSFFHLRNPNDSVIKNYISNTYLGCCMAFKSHVKKKLLPIPKNAIYHDRWIGIMGKFVGFKISFINEPFILYVRHEHNVSRIKRRKIIIIIKDRLSLFKAILKGLINVKKVWCK